MPLKKEVKPLPDNIYNVPENIAAVRKNLFQVNDTITLSLEEYNKYWPYVDNVWSSKGTPDTLKDGSIVEYFRCRCHPTEEYIPENKANEQDKKLYMTRYVARCLFESPEIVTLSTLDKQESVQIMCIH